jgi:hypothetical protein
LKTIIRKPKRNRKGEKAVAQQPFYAIAGSVELSFSQELFCKIEDSLLRNPPHRKATRRYHTFKQNEMRKIIFTITITIAFFTTTQAQYSTYYNVDVNQRVNANINQNVNVSGIVYENKTITTIDYGALQLANAQRESNKLEKIKYADEQQRRISLEVASNPVKAFDYGEQNIFTIKGKDAKAAGFMSFKMSHKVPHSSMFVYAGAGRLENVSQDGITTEIIFSLPLYNKKELYKNFNVVIDVEKTAKMEMMQVGQLNNNGDGEIFVHKKEVNRANVFGTKGFKSTIIWEDNYQYTITDNFQSYDSSEKNGVLYFVKIRTYGSKNEVNFEKLEGRRYYLRQLIEKIISTAIVYDMKY